MPGMFLYPSTSNIFLKIARVSAWIEIAEELLSYFVDAIFKPYHPFLPLLLIEEGCKTLRHLIDGFDNFNDMGHGTCKTTGKAQVTRVPLSRSPLVQGAFLHPSTYDLENNVSSLTTNWNRWREPLSQFADITSRLYWQLWLLKWTVFGIISFREIWESQ